MSLDLLSDDEILEIADEAGADENNVLTERIYHKKVGWLVKDGNPTSEGFRFFARYATIRYMMENK